MRTSAKDRERMQEAMIMQALREEGLITRPQGQGASGFSFEITAEGEMMKRPPPRLEKLEKRRKKKRALTEEEIREKLERAERRKRVSYYSHLLHRSSVNSLNSLIRNMFLFPKTKDRRWKMTIK